jgi:hypothetical protein
VRQLAFNNRKNTVLLFLGRFGVVDVADTAVELDSRSQCAHPTVLLHFADLSEM